MAAQAKGEGGKAQLDDIAWLLFDQARLLDGEPLSDPAGFSRKLAAVLAKAI